MGITHCAQSLCFTVMMLSASVPEEKQNGSCTIASIFSIIHFRVMYGNTVASTENITNKLNHCTYLAPNCTTVEPL